MPTKLKCAYCGVTKLYPGDFFSPTMAECWKCVIKREYKSSKRKYKRIIEFFIKRFGMFQEPMVAMEFLLEEYKKDKFKKKKYHK